MERGDAPRTVSPGTIVEELLTAFPELAAVFFRRRMACVGCTMSRFETVAEVAGTYGLDLDGFVAELGASLSTP
jgi:hybrid cluster-associated redox disulfide protein